MDQQQLEARLAEVAAPQEGEQRTRAQLYGSLESWCFTLGSWSFFLDPSQRLWYFWDPLHDEYRCTGFGPQQVRFVLQGRDWQALPLTPYCQQCRMTLPEDSKFCHLCGQAAS